MKVDVCKTQQIHPEILSKVMSTLLIDEEYEAMSIIFKMLSDPTRLKILSALFVSEMCVCDLQEVLEVSQSAISHQLSNLKQTRLVKSRKSGKNVFYSLNDNHIAQIFKQTLEHVRE